MYNNRARFLGGLICLILRANPRFSLIHGLFKLGSQVGLVRVGTYLYGSSGNIFGQHRPMAADLFLPQVLVLKLVALEQHHAARKAGDTHGSPVRSIKFHDRGAVAVHGHR